MPEEFGSRWIVAMNIGSRLVISDQDEIGLIDCFLDMDNDETLDGDDAVTAIVKWPDGYWSRVPLSEFNFGDTRLH